MKVQVEEWTTLNDSDEHSLKWLCQHSGLVESQIELLVESGVLISLGEKPHEPVFSFQALSVARRARRLLDDFELDRHGVVLALTLIQRVRDLQLELSMLRAQLHQQVSGDDDDEINRKTTSIS